MGKKGKYEGSSDEETEVRSSLPPIRDISWVTPSTFSEKRVELGEEKESGGITRVEIMYKYPAGKKALVLTCERDESAFFRSNGLEEDSYIVKKTGARTLTGRHVMKFYMDGDNPHHEEFEKCMDKVRQVVKKKLSKSTESKVSVSIRGMYDTVDDEKTKTGTAITAKVVESKTGDIYSVAYDQEKQLAISDVGRCHARPALSFGYTVSEDDKEYKLNVTVGQVYVKPYDLFPLRDRD